MLSFEKLKSKANAFKSLTGLTLKEFESLLEPFDSAYKDYIQETQVNGKKRQRILGGGRKAKLASSEQRLLFILFYFKIYPLQQVIGFFFGMSQAQANEWIHRLSGILQTTLGYQLMLPERNPLKLEQVLSECPALEFIIDGTERPIQRPKDNDRQKKFYSGKKKRHSVKNNVITNYETKKINYLSKTYEGKKHDKKICDEENYHFPDESILLKDTGYQGYEPDNVLNLQPKKKPRKKELTEEEKQENKLISCLRIRVEHVIGGIKICRIVKDIFRNTKENYSDLVMEIACGLHNLRVSQRIGQV